MQLDSVLDKLLQSLLELVPYESAQILLLESDSRLFVARAAHPRWVAKQSVRYPPTLDATGYPFVERVLASQVGVLLRDGIEEREWHDCADWRASRKSMVLSSKSAPQIFVRSRVQYCVSTAIVLPKGLQGSVKEPCLGIGAFRNS